MKILLASDAYHFSTNGVANVVTVLENGMRGLGHEVKVLTLSDCGKSRREGNCYLIGSHPSHVYPDVRFSLIRSDPLLDELIRWKPDLVHLHTEGTVARMARAVAAGAEAPLVMTVHTDYAYYAFGRFHETPPVRGLMNAIGKRFYRNAAAVTVPSEKARSFPQLLSVTDRIVLVPNGIRLERYRKPVSPAEKAELFRQWGLKDNGFTLVMITRVSREKNIMEILRFLPSLIRELPEAQLLIVGDGPERKRLEKYAADSGLKDRVTFTGRIPPDEVYRYYAMGDVFVSASVFEVHSMSYLEAMSCGLPLVCREDASLLGVLENGVNGYTFRTESEFTGHVAEILRDRALRDRMGEAAARRADEFSDRHFVENMLRAYEDVLKSRKAPSA